MSGFALVLSRVYSCCLWEAWSQRSLLSTIRSGSAFQMSWILASVSSGPRRDGESLHEEGATWRCSVPGTPSGRLAWAPLPLIGWSTTGNATHTLCCPFSVSTYGHRLDELQLPAVSEVWRAPLGCLLSGSSSSSLRELLALISISLHPFSRNPPVGVLLPSPPGLCPLLRGYLSPPRSLTC